LDCAWDATWLVVEWKGWQADPSVSRSTTYCGKILPWDWDVDTQVSGATLLYIADYHNRTIHEYVSEDKKFQRKYLLDVNPWSRQRDPGDGANIIDARWIDMTNGLYIDITGLSEVYPDQKPGIWSCKNFHDYRVRDLYPMRVSLFEGVRARIPYAYDQILVEEYRPQALVNMTHEWYGVTRVARAVQLLMWETGTNGMKT
jgi:LicD family